MAIISNEKKEKGLILNSTDTPNTPSNQSSENREQQDYSTP